MVDLNVLGGINTDGGGGSLLDDSIISGSMLPSPNSTQQQFQLDMFNNGNTINRNINRNNINNNNNVNNNISNMNNINSNNNINTNNNNNNNSINNNNN